MIVSNVKMDKKKEKKKRIYAQLVFLHLFVVNILKCPNASPLAPTLGMWESNCRKTIPALPRGYASWFCELILNAYLEYAPFCLM